MPIRYRYRTSCPLPQWLCALLVGLPLALMTGQALAGSEAPPQAPITNPAAHPLRLAANPAPLRVALLRSAEAAHPHRNIAGELAWLTHFANASGRKLDVDTVARPEDLITRLARGETDIALGDLPPEAETLPELAHSESFHRVTYRVVGPAEWTLTSPLELAGKRIALSTSSPLWHYFERLAQAEPSLTLVALPEYLTRSELLTKLSRRELDLAVLADDGNSAVLDDYPSLAWQFALTPPQPVGFHVASSNERLLHDINDRLLREPLYATVREGKVRDLARIQDSGVLRVITQPNGRNFYLRKGRPAGLEFHLARQFAANLGVQPEFLIAESGEQMLEWLHAGVGDIVTMALPERLTKGEPGIAFSREYHVAAPTVLARASVLPERLEDLHGAVLGAEAGTIAYRSLSEFAKAHPELELTVRKLPTPLAKEDGQAALVNVELDGLVISGRELAGWMAAAPTLAAGPTLPLSHRSRWAVRARDETLGDAVDHFIASVHEGDSYAQASALYFDHERPRDYVSLSPYDHYLREYAVQYQFDWRLLAAVVYQESRFDPRATSPDGARGLMQLMPQTAAALGFKQVNDPEISIHAGTKYLATIRDRFDRSLPLRERTLFALAGYNAGPARVDQARRLAAEQGLDPDRWFDNVETAMLRLGNSGERCWCEEPVKYVRRIARYYDNYRTFSRIAAVRMEGMVPLASTRKEGGKPTL